MIRIALVLMMVLTSFAFAATINVPADVLTIQSGINSVGYHDTVLVAPGVYLENLDFNGKPVVLLSSQGPSATIIAASTVTLPVIDLTSAEPKGTIIEGFTIRGSHIGGIVCSRSSPTIRNNIITQNSSNRLNNGAGIDLKFTVSSVITGNIFQFNTADTYGAGIHVGNDDASSTNDTISYNLFYDNSGFGEIRALGDIVGLVINNNTVATTTYHGIQIQIHDGGGAKVRNNIVFNAPVCAISVWQYGDVDVDYNCAFDNLSVCSPGEGPNDVKENAGFVNAAAGDFHLTANSPCINAGDPDPFYNDADGSRNDIGALPFSSLLAGDLDGDGIVSISDAVFLVVYIFADGPAPDPLTLADTNCDGHYNLTDAVVIIAYLFADGPAPCVR